jgi:hypothetical protein
MKHCKIILLVGLLASSASDVTGLSFFLNGLTDNGEKVLIEVSHRDADLIR